MCQSMVNIQSPTAEIRRGKKRKKKKKEERRNSMKIYMVSLLHRATIKKNNILTRDGIAGRAVLLTVVLSFSVALCRDYKLIVKLFTTLCPSFSSYSYEI